MSAKYIVVADVQIVNGTVKATFDKNFYDGWIDDEQKNSDGWDACGL